MPRMADTRFFRQRGVALDRIATVIPSNATMKPELADRMKTLGLAEHLAPTDPHTRTTTFHYVDYPPSEALLEDGTTVDDGVYEFTFRDAVTSFFAQPIFEGSETTWSFSTTHQVEVVAALRIGETLEVLFEEELERADGVVKYHFPPPGIPDSGYGSYGISYSVDGLNTRGFRIVSSFEPQSKRTASRLPFFFGFRVFGRSKADDKYPIWRELLSQAVREALAERWELTLLYTAFSLESFIDKRLADKLTTAKVGNKYIDHVLRVGQREPKLHALNAPEKKWSSTKVKKTAERLNELVFSPRNALAHGKTQGADVTAEQATRALTIAVEFMWDWDKEARPLLLTRMGGRAFETMIDDELLKACRDEI